MDEIVAHHERQGLERAEHVYPRRLEPRLLVRLAQGGTRGAVVVGVDPAPGEGDLAGVVREVNTRVARVEAVRKFRMLHTQLDHEDGELTATQKLKRAAFAATVPHLVEDMYAGTSEHAGADLGRSG